ncbi:MAG: hypothetical protein V4510_00650 [bacterium]
MDPDLQEAARAIARVAATPPPPSRVFHPLIPGPGGLQAAAIDGSHAVLVDNGAIWAVAVRAACVTWPGPRTQPPTRIHATTPAAAQGLLDDAFAVVGLEAPRASSAEAWAEALRSLAEFNAIQQAVMRPGTVLVDGALRGLPRHAQAMADRIEAAAHPHTVVIGVSKRSAIEADGVPLAAWLQRNGPAGCWAVDVAAGSYVARLHDRAQHAFRIDAPDLAAVARLLPSCRDAAYVGYPYPLAVAHNAVALTGTEVADLRGRLSNEVRKAGGAGAAGLMQDFHDVLDRNVPR